MDYQSNAVWSLYKSLTAGQSERHKKGRERPKTEEIKSVQVRRGLALQALWKGLFPGQSWQSLSWCMSPRQSMFRWVFYLSFVGITNSTKCWYFLNFWLQQESWTKLIDLKFCFALPWFPPASPCALGVLGITKCCCCLLTFSSHISSLKSLRDWGVSCLVLLDLKPRVVEVLTLESDANSVTKEKLSCVTWF